MSNGNRKANKLTTALLITYLITLFWILLFKLGVRFSYMENRIVNLIPFTSIDRSEAILNVVIFVPLGIYAGVLFKSWSWTKKLFFFFLVSLMFEVFQFIFKIGAFDITDIITNASGGTIGLLIFEVIRKLFNNTGKAQKLINIIGAAGTVIMITLLVLLKLNMLPIRYQ